MDDPTSRHELPSLTVSDADLAGAVFIIPIDAPLPNELADLNVPTGSLLKRLAALDPVDAGSKFNFVPVSGGELNNLAAAWHDLQVHKAVYVLTELPGARYDALFDNARRVIGLRSLDWPQVAIALESHHRLIQRTTDKSPWQLSKPGERRLPRTNEGPTQRLEVPQTDEDDDGEVRHP